MKRFVAQLNGGDYINIAADRMELNDSFILAYQGNSLVAVLDFSVVLSAHIGEKAKGE